MSTRRASTRALAWRREMPCPSESTPTSEPSRDAVNRSMGKKRPRPGAGPIGPARASAEAGAPEPSEDQGAQSEEGDTGRLGDDQGAGLESGEIYYEYNNYQPRGVVHGQSLEPGVEVKGGTLVDITVSNGRPPDRFIVPDVIGFSLEQAKKSIRSSGLRIGDIKYEIQPTLLQDTIIRQSYDPDEEVQQFTKIDLVVSKQETNE